MQHQHHIIAELWPALEAAGFAMGVDTHLRILQLLERGDDAEETLQFALATIVCKNKEQQKQFYALFEEAKRRAEAKLQAELLPEIPFWRKPTIQIMMVGLACLCLLGVGIWFYLQKTPTPSQAKHLAVEIVEGQRKLVPLDTLFSTSRVEKFDRVAVLQRNRMQSPKTQAIKEDTLNGQFLLIETTQAATQDYRDTFAVYRSVGRLSDTLYLYIHVLHLQTTTEPPVKDTGTVYLPPRTDTLPYKEYCLDPPLAMLKMKYGSGLDFTGAQWTNQGLLWRFLASLLLLIGAYLLWKWLQKRWKDDSTVLKQERSQVPPFTWDLKLDASSQVQLTERFYLIANQLRRRSESERLFLNLPKTIERSIRKAGMVDFQFKAGSQSNDYLVLLDMSSPQNHRAQLYRFLIQQFSTQQVNVERFFYNRDLRLCWNEHFPEGLRLADLQHRYSTSRLLIVGTASQLISTADGTLAAWTTIFEAWRQKAILTPKFHAQWDADEATLAQRFLLLPATVQGFLALVEQLEANDKPDFRAWKQRKDDSLRPLLLPEGEVMPLLQSYFDIFTEDSVDERLTQWVAACAIFPQLNWELTLHLGHLIAPDLLDVDNLFKINRLAWFQQGEIPTDSRREMLAWLRAECPALERKVRLSIQDILERSTPPAGSAAAEQHEMRRLENQLMLLLPEETAKRWQLKQQMARLDVKQDALVAEVIAAETEQDLKAPTWLQRYPSLWKWTGRVAYVGFWAALLLLLWCWNDRRNDCADCTVFGYKNEHYSIKDGNDYLTFMTNAVADLQFSPDSVRLERVKDTAFAKINEDLLHCDVANNTATTVALLLDKVDALVQRSKATLSAENLYYNVAIQYYNRGMQRYNLNENYEASSWFLSGLEFVNQQKDTDLYTLKADFEEMLRLTENRIEPPIEQAPTTTAPKTPKKEQKVRKVKALVVDTLSSPTQSTTTAWSGEMILVQGGTFLMGSDEKDKDADKYEFPQHKVSVPSFYIGKYEVTQKQWREVMGKDPEELGFKSCDDCPVEGVNWNDVQEFLQALNKKTGLNYRLPSEAEWEYAARGGQASNKNNYMYAGSNNIDEVAWYSGNSDQKTHPVGKKKANTLGIFDMTGNVWEWCQDTWHEDYKGAPDNGSAWESKGSYRVDRGGSWGNASEDCRVAFRDSGTPEFRFNTLGFRVCLPVR
jgi:formylglycine-generating enzyme required for sulfatase activity